MLKNATLLILSLLVALLLAEVALRFTVHRYLLHPYAGFPDHYFVEDSELGIDMAPDFPPTDFLMQGPTAPVFTNRFGCFDYDQAVEDGYILIIGDSTTWGYAPLEQKWTTLLGERLGRQVLKCGISGTGPKYQQIKARRVIEQSGKTPGAIILLYDSNNDFNDDVVFPGYAVIRGQRIKNLKSLDLRDGRIERYTRAELETRYDEFITRHQRYSLQGRVLHFLKQRSVLVAFLQHQRENYQYRQAPGATTASPGPLLKSRYGYFLWSVDPEEYPWVEQAFEEHVDNVMSIRRLAQAHGAEFILFSTDLPKTEFRGRLRNRFEQSLPYYLDMGAPLRERSAGALTNWYYNGHWNILGNRLAADAMYEYIVDRDVFER